VNTLPSNLSARASLLADKLRIEVSYLIRATLASAILLAAVPCLAVAPTRRNHATPHATIRHAKTATATVRHEPVGMPTERATQIQTALIKQGYLTGEPTGVWNAESVAAMQKLQGDNGWQTKITPDARALIKLGLGPQADTPATNTQVSN
jgi:hypothetical protein